MIFAAHYHITADAVKALYHLIPANEQLPQWVGIGIPGIYPAKPLSTPEAFPGKGRELGQLSFLYLTFGGPGQKDANDAQHRQHAKERRQFYPPGPALPIRLLHPVPSPSGLQYPVPTL